MHLAHAISELVEIPPKSWNHTGGVPKGKDLERVQ
jgi:hypothetical protein